MPRPPRARAADVPPPVPAAAPAGAPPAPPRARPDVSPRVARAVAYLHAHYGERVALAHLARLAGLSRYHFMRVFAREVGAPPHAYHTRLRVAHAQARLRAGEPPSAVAYACGFTDQSHLSHVFKAAVGLTPGRYAAAARRGAGAPPPGPAPAAAPPAVMPNASA